MTRRTQIGIALILCIVLVTSGIGGGWIARRTHLIAQRDKTIAQLGSETTQDAPCAQGTRRDIVLVNFPATVFAGSADDLLGRDSVDVISAGQNITAFYSSTFGTMRTITADVIPELLLSSTTFLPSGSPQTLDTVASIIRRSGQVVVNVADTDGSDIRFAGCLSAENQSPPAVHRAIIGDRLLLTGWQLAIAGGSGAGVLSLTLNWHVQAPDIDDVGVFVQVFDASGALIAETRGYPLAGASPSRLWRLGDQWRDVHVIHVSNTAGLKGNYRVMVGLYTTADGQLLHAYNLSGTRISGDMVTITQR